MGIQNTKTYRIQKSSDKREVHRDECLPPEIINSQINNLNLHLKKKEKEEHKKPKVRD